MPDTTVSRKWSCLKKCLLTAGLLALFCQHAEAQQKGTFSIGIQTGWALGFKSEFGMQPIDFANHPPMVYGSRLRHQLGGHIQYNISDRFGVQFSLFYQNGTYTSPQYSRPTAAWSQRTEASSFTAFGLNGVYSFPERKNLSFYILGGGGTASGDDWIHGPDSFYIFTGGGGVNIYLGRKSGWASNLGLSFHHLYDPAGDYRSSTIHGSFIRFNFGCGYVPRAHAD